MAFRFSKRQSALLTLTAYAGFMLIWNSASAPRLAGAPPPEGDWIERLREEEARLDGAELLLQVLHVDRFQSPEIERLKGRARIERLVDWAARNEREVDQTSIVMRAGRSFGTSFHQITDVGDFRAEAKAYRAAHAHHYHNGDGGVLALDYSEWHDGAERIVLLGTHFFVTGRRSMGPGLPEWVIQSRKTDSGALEVGFGRAGIPSFGGKPTVRQTEIKDVATDGKYLYLLRDDFSGMDSGWVIEKRNKQTGSR